jgi:hypothetical protein
MQSFRLLWKGGLKLNRKVSSTDAFRCSSGRRDDPDFQPPDKWSVVHCGEFVLCPPDGSMDGEPWRRRFGFASRFWLCSMGCSVDGLIGECLLPLHWTSLIAHLGQKMVCRWHIPDTSSWWVGEVVNLLSPLTFHHRRLIGTINGTSKSAYRSFVVRRRAFSRWRDTTAGSFSHLFIPRPKLFPRFVPQRSPLIFSGKRLLHRCARLF